MGCTGSAAKGVHPAWLAGAGEVPTGSPAAGGGRSRGDAHRL